MGRYRMLTQARELPLQMYQCINHRYFFQNCPHYTSPPSQIGPFFTFSSMTGIDGIFPYGILFFFKKKKTLSFTNLAPDTSRFLSENEIYIYLKLHFLFNWLFSFLKFSWLKQPRKRGKKCLFLTNLFLPTQSLLQKWEISQKLIISIECFFFLFPLFVVVFLMFSFCFY